MSIPIGGIPPPPPPFLLQQALATGTTSTSSPALQMAPQHIDTQQCFTDLTKISPEAILTIAYAASNDGTLLLKLEQWYNEIPAEIDVVQLRQEALALRRDNKKDNFATARVLDGIYSLQQRRVLQQILEKRQQIEQVRLSRLAGELPLFPAPVAEIKPPPPPQFRLYIGGLDMDLSTPDLRAALSVLGGIKNVSHPSNRANPLVKSSFAFVEFESYNYLESALTRPDPVTLRGKSLKMEIPKDSLGPLTQWLSDQRAFEKKHGLPFSFAIPMDNDDDNDGEGGQSKNGAKNASNPLPDPDPINGTSVCIANMFTQADKDEVGEEDLVEEVREQCNKFGTIISITINLQTPVLAQDISGTTSQYFPVFVKYQSNQEAQKALLELGGLTFDGRRLYAFVTK